MKYGKVCQKCKKAKALSQYKSFKCKTSGLTLHRDQCIECEEAFKKSRGAQNEQK